VGVLVYIRHYHHHHLIDNVTYSRNETAGKLLNWHLTLITHSLNYLQLYLIYRQIPWVRIELLTIFKLKPILFKQLKQEKLSKNRPIIHEPNPCQCPSVFRGNNFTGRRQSRISKLDIFYFLRCSITRDDYTSARTDKVKNSKLIK